jgi:hypothetical protein
MIELEYTWIRTGPRWWQLRWRYHLWRFRRLIAREDAKLTPEMREARDEMRREIDRAFFFGSS